MRTRYFREENRSFNTFNNLVLENGSFVRLQYLVLAYKVPLKTTAQLKDLSLEIGGHNLLTLSAYTGLDPEVRLGDTGASDNGNFVSGNINPVLPGIDRRNTYPLARVLWFGLKANF